jgi:hypothetical protein
MNTSHESFPEPMVEALQPGHPSIDGSDVAEFFIEVVSHEGNN